MTSCQILTRSNQPHALLITNFITETTTPKEFEEYRKGFPEFQISFGGRCGWNVFCTCAKLGNANLLKYLLQSYGDVFANIGNQFGHTPIFCATRCENQDNAISCIKVLLEFGGNPTITTTQTSMGDVKTPTGTSPLQNCCTLKRQKVQEFLENL